MKRFFAFFALFLIFETIVVAQEWELIRDEDGVEVYYKAPNSKGIIEVKAIETLETNLSTLVAVLIDFENYVNWKESCKYAKVISTISSSDIVYYYQTDLPWPISDRDCVLRFKYSQDSTTKVVNAKATCASGYMPVDEDYERDYDNVVIWTLTPLSNGKVKVYNYLAFKVNDSFPDWLVKQAVDSGPFNTMVNLQSQIKLAEFKNAKITNIKN